MRKTVLHDVFVGRVVRTDVQSGAGHKLDTVAALRITGTAVQNDVVAFNGHKGGNTSLVTERGLVPESGNVPWL